MKKSLVTFVLLVLGAVPSAATTLDLGLNDTSAQAQLAYPVSQDAYGTSLLRGRLLYNDRQDTVLGSVGFDFMGEPGNVPGLQVGVGGEVLGGEADKDQQFAAVALGVRGNLAPPALNGLGVGGRLYYAPKVLTFSDAERIWEAAGQVSFAVTPKAKLYLEYQGIRSRFEDHGTWSIDDGVRLGFEAHF